MTYNVHKVIPISDINPARNTPAISRVFMISTILIFILIQPKNQIELINFFYQYSAIPCELINFAPISESQFYNNSCFYDQFKVIFPNKNLFLSVILANLFHANFLHILGYLWSFWIFGNNVEDKLGKVKFLLFRFVPLCLLVFLFNFFVWRLGRLRGLGLSTNALNFLATVF